jgi:CspA family cold shock protein
MTEGMVKFFNTVKQFGFINGDDGKSYYFHATQIEQGTRLTDGDRVSFTGVQGDRGPKAEKVRKITEDEKAGSEEPGGEDAEAETTEDSEAEEESDEE